MLFSFAKQSKRTPDKGRYEIIRGIRTPYTDYPVTFITRNNKVVCVYNPKRKTYSRIGYYGNSLGYFGEGNFSYKDSIGRLTPESAIYYMYNPPKNRRLGFGSPILKDEITHILPKSVIEAIKN